MEKNNKIKMIQRITLFFIVSLILSGITAIPALQELGWLLRHIPTELIGIRNWINLVHNKMLETSPILFYGYDWLAFAHIVIAILFIGVYRNPVKNCWVVEFGMIACLLIIPFAFIFGAYRGIPVWWQLIDCSFGILGLIPLLIIRRLISCIEQETRLEKICVFF